MRISIHALREEGDGLGFTRIAASGNISIHALREEGDDFLDLEEMHLQQISIHALREEGDQNMLFRLISAGNISIHALREEGDSTRFTGCNFLKAFLSTPSVRRATLR